MEHFTDTFEHDSITDENRSEFNTAMAKYTSVDDAVVGGYNASKLTGKPFKMPESLDKLPDDASRADFTSQARGLLGIDIPKDVESLKDLNFKEGLAEGAAVDENFVGMVKSWAVEQGIPMAVLEKIAGFYNGPIQKYSQEAYAEKQETDKLEAAKACNEALIAHPNFGSEEKVRERTILLNRALLDSKISGLTAEEAAEVADEMAGSMLTKNPVMARAMLNMISPLAAEGSTDGGSGPGVVKAGQKLTPYEYKKDKFPKTESLWGKTTDAWSDQSLELRRQAGYKE